MKETIERQYHLRILFSKLQKSFLCLCMFSVILLTGNYAQNSSYNNRTNYVFETYAQNNLTQTKFFQQEVDKLGLSPDCIFKLQQEVQGLSETRHFRFKQFHKEFPVYASTLILHERDGIVHHVNGNYLSGINVNVQAQISADQAVQIAMHHLDLSTIANTPNPLLHIVDAQFPKQSRDYRLAYVFQIETRLPFRKIEYLVDAHTGEYLNSFSKIFDVAVEGKGITTYYGEKTFISDSIAPNQFTLHDPTRGDGITTRTDINGSSEELKDADNYWDLTDIEHGTTAIDVHWGTQKFWDLLSEKLSWEGLDDNGRSMDPIVQVLSGANFANAQWTGENALFGNGDCFHNSFTSLDVVGHEFTHGIIQETANLLPISESGAINESICDVLGKCLEYYEDQDNFTWKLGERFVDSPFAHPFRNMADPNEFEDPKLYQGEYWSDCGTIHYNAGVGNFWFYLLAEGGTGVNELGEAYDISPIGIENAMKIVFTSLTAYLTENSRYYEYYLASLQATENLFGAGAAEIEIVREAWLAVGVQEGISPVSGIELLVDFDNPFQSTINYFCENGALYQDTVLIINSGTVDYTANMFAELKLAIGPNSYYKTIDMDVPAGDTAYLSINDIVPIDFNGRRTLFATIELPDNQVECLASVLVVLQNSTITERDVRVSSLYRSTPCEEDRGLVYSIRLNNTSCEEIPADTKFKVSVFDSGNLVYEEEMETFLAIGQGALTSFQIELDYALLSGANLEVQVDMDGDIDPDNNTSLLTYRESQQNVNSEYLNSFTTEISPFNKVKYDTRTQITEPYIYNSESYFASSSRLENPEAAFCNIPEDYFIGGLSSSGKTTQLSMCVDLEGYVSSMLKFDFIQFRNDNFEYKDLITSSAMKLVIDGEVQFDEDFIYDLDEGEKYSFEYNLESNFQGNISLQFFNRSGVSPSDSNFLDYDVILIDNLEIVEGVTDIKETEGMKKFTSIYPNPSSDKFYLETSKEIRHITVYNTQGKIVEQISQPDSEISISQIGYYLLKIEYWDKTLATLPCIKLK